MREHIEKFKEHADEFIENEHVKAFIANDIVRTIALAVGVGFGVVVALYIGASFVLWMNPFATVSYLSGGITSYIFRIIGLVVMFFVFMDEC